MNMQTVQFLFLLLDGVIKLASWRMVTEAMERIGYGASENLARSLGVVAVSCAGLCAFPPVAVTGPLMRICHSCAAMASSDHIGNPLFGLILFVAARCCWTEYGCRTKDDAHKCRVETNRFC